MGHRRVKHETADERDRRWGANLVSEFGINAKQDCPCFEYLVARFAAAGQNADRAETNAYAHARMHAWASTGFPFIRLASEKLAASLMLTKIDNLEDLFPPFLDFKIAIPGGLLFDTVNEIHVTRVHVSANQDGSWTFNLGSNDPTHKSSQWTCLIESLADKIIPSDATTIDGTPIGDIKANEHNRLINCIHRLVVGVSFLWDRDRDTQTRHVTRAHRAENRDAANVQIQTYIMGRDVHLDVRSAVQDYIRGNGKAKTVQWLTAGHWRWQPYGPNLSLRKRIHIEPHWNNRDKGLPILVRNHVKG